MLVSDSSVTVPGSVRWNIVEFPGDAQALASLAYPDDRWIATTPVAVDELEQMGQAYTLDGGISEADELNLLGMSNFRRATELANACDQAVLDHCPTVRQVGLLPFTGHYTRVKFILDAITVRLNILDRIAKHGGAGFRKTRTPGESRDADNDFFYDSRTSLYNKLLDLLAEQASIPVDWVLGSAAPSSTNHRRRPTVRAIARRIKNISRDIAADIRTSLVHRSQPRRILLATAFPELVRAASELCKNGPTELYRIDYSGPRLYRHPGRSPYKVGRPADIERQVREELEGLDLIADGTVQEGLCQENGIAFTDLVRQAFERYLQRAFPRAVALRAFLSECHDEAAFDMVLSQAGPERIESSALFDFCRQEGVPAVVVQHGGYGYVDNPIVNHYEFNFQGEFLSWGRGVEEHYGVTKCGETDFVPTGAPSLDDLVARRTATARLPKRVMYVVTELRGYSAYFPGGQGWLDSTYYRLQKSVLELLEKYQDSHDVWFKPPPGMDRNTLARNPLPEWLNERGSRIRVESGSLMEIIDRPSLFIIDFPSTALVQCLATQARVIVFTGAPHFPILPEARRLLERRAICCDSEEEFFTAIESHLSGESLQWPTGEDGASQDDTFLAQYGTFQQDGKSLARIQDRLQEILVSGNRG